MQELLGKAEDDNDDNDTDDDIPDLALDKALADLRMDELGADKVSVSHNHNKLRKNTFYQ